MDGSKAKLSEHGGFSAFDDRSVGLLVASPALTSTAAGSRCAAPVLSKSVSGCGTGGCGEDWLVT